MITLERIACSMMLTMSSLYSDDKVLKPGETNTTVRCPGTILIRLTMAFRLLRASRTLWSKSLSAPTRTMIAGRMRASAACSFARSSVKSWLISPEME